MRHFKCSSSLPLSRHVVSVCEFVGVTDYIVHTGLQRERRERERLGARVQTSTRRACACVGCPSILRRPVCVLVSACVLASRGCVSYSRAVRNVPKFLKMQVCGAVDAMVAANIVSLPDSILFELCAYYLNECACLNLRAANHALHSALVHSVQADLGVWKPRVEALLAGDTERCGHAARTHELQFAFLRRHVEKRGAYLWSLRTLGGIVDVQLLSPSRLVATLTMRPEVGVGVEYVTVDLFQIALGESGAAHDDVLIMSAQNGVENGTVPFNTVARCGDTLTLSVVSPSVDAPCTISAAHCLARVRSRPRVCNVLPATGLGPLRTIGLTHCYYHGSYGGHGRELLHISWGALQVIPGAIEVHGATEGLNGLKLCGDPNVPSGERSFAAFGELLPPDRISAIEPAGCLTGSCRCQFDCACFRRDELAPRGDVTILGAMAAVMRTAMAGHQSPTDNPAKLIFYRTRAATTVPTELHNVACAPVATDQAVHMLLVSDGADFKTSMRISPFELHRRTPMLRSPCRVFPDCALDKR